MKSMKFQSYGDVSLIGILVTLASTIKANVRVTTTAAVLLAYNEIGISREIHFSAFQFPIPNTCRYYVICPSHKRFSIPYN